MQINAQGRNVLQMQTTNPLHMKKDLPVAASSAEKSFGEIFFQAVDQVNGDQSHANALQEEAIISPDTVNVADIMIATEKARLSASLLKSVVDRASRSFTDIMNIR